jgi:hypothetical protein
MGRFTISFKYTNDDTISDQIKEYRKFLEDEAKKKGAIGTVADGDIRITAKLKKSSIQYLDMRTDYLHNHKEFPELLNILADELGILAGLIEKDYWIMHVLYSLKTGLELDSKKKFFLKILNLFLYLTLV